ncbi:MAG: isoaspartyl peptidase/L-asparaginase [Gammaproteobacteria bacterium]
MPPPEFRFGTVGAVAVDHDGNVAAGTSTGGMTNKRFGRIGDVPVIGAGTYADNDTCAVSATGHGEYFIRSVVGHDIAAQIRYAGRSLQAAAEDVVLRKLVNIGGTGGIISINRHGEISMVHNTPGMYRGSIDITGRLSTAIYKDE